MGNDDFLYCHCIAESEEDVYRQLDAFDLEGKVVSSMVGEMFQFMSAYRDSNQILQQFPEKVASGDPTNRILFGRQPSIKLMAFLNI